MEKHQHRCEGHDSHRLMRHRQAGRYEIYKSKHAQRVLHNGDETHGGERPSGIARGRGAETHGDRRHREQGGGSGQQSMVELNSSDVLG